jgi:hypothetical protein
MNEAAWMGRNGSGQATPLVPCDTQPVRRVVLAVLLALLTFDVSGLASVCGDAACNDDSCPGEFSGGECAPNCHSCTCCSLPKVAGSAATVALVAPSAHGLAWVGSIDRLPSPEPADILHVPKLPRA